jgi:hypothetical protein
MTMVLSQATAAVDGAPHSAQLAAECLPVKPLHVSAYRDFTDDEGEQAGAQGIDVRGAAAACRGAQQQSIGQPDKQSCGHAAMLHRESEPRSASWHPNAVYSMDGVCSSCL